MGYKMFPQVRILHIIHLHRSWGDLSPQRNLLYTAPGGTPCWRGNGWWRGPVPWLGRTDEIRRRDVGDVPLAQSDQGMSQVPS